MLSRASSAHELSDRDPALAEQARLLKVSPFFTQDGSLEEKQLIFYVLAGIKPLSEVGSVHMEWLSPDYAESRPDSQEDVATFLDKLGLHYAFRSPHDGTVTVSLREDLIRTAQAIDIHGDEATVYRKYGELYGYPETAVEAAVAEWAYGRPSLLRIDEQQQIEDASGLPREAFIFRFSKAHWQEELEIVRRWYAVLVTYGMDQPNVSHA
jgi:hypothetical protein